MILIFVLLSLQAIQENITDARRRGDQMEVSVQTMEMQKLHQKEGINPIKNMFPLFVQVSWESSLS